MGLFEQWISRLETELRMAEAYLELRPDSGCIEEVAAIRARLNTGKPGLNSNSVESFVMECEDSMKRISAVLKDVTVHFVAHAHIDMNWMWAYDETVAVTLDTFGTMLTLMGKYPEFTFSQSQASVYRIVEQYNPAMLEEIKRRVAEGRWEPSSCTWVEGDKNMASGESQVRQILYTKRYFNSLFGIDYDGFSLDFEPDTFGHSVNVPAVLSMMGVKYYYHCRAFDGPKIYRWQAPSGGSVLCYMEKSDWYNYDVTPGTVADSIVNELKETGLNDVLRVYGVGDHGGGPTIRDVENIRRIADWPVFPTVKFSTYRDYFDAVVASPADIPTVEGEHNFVFTGCYTSQSEIKKANRFGEKSLTEAETFSALAMTHAGSHYPNDSLTNAWEKHLFNQFHDILPGSGVRDTREYSMGKFQEVMAATSSAKKQALKAIADTIDTRALLTAAEIKDTDSSDRALGAGVGFWQENNGLSSSSTGDGNFRIFTVFNPSPFARSEVVEAVLWDMKGSGGLVVKDCHGAEVQSQLLRDNGEYWAHRFKTILFEAANIPALGYKVFVVCEDLSKPVDSISAWDLRVEKPLDAAIENEYLSASIDTRSGALKSLKLKDGEIELIPEGRQSGLFRIIDESPAIRDGMTAWLIGSYAGEALPSGVCFNASMKQAQAFRSLKSSFTSTRGPLRNGLVWTVDIRNSKLTVGMYLDKGSRSLRIDCKCDWLEQGVPDSHVPQLNVVFRLPIEDSTRLYEVPFGVVERDALEMDVPGLRWADLSGSLKGSDGIVGLTVATDSKYGFRAGEDSMSVSLIRSTCDPDPYPEYGEHKFSLAIIPHANKCCVEDAFAEAIRLDQPLTVFQTTAHPGVLPAELSFVQIKNDNIMVSGLKKAEDNDNLVMRIYEVSGRDTIAEIFFRGEVNVTEVDGMERKIGNTMSCQNGVIEHSIRAHSVAMLMIEPSNPCSNGPG